MLSFQDDEFKELIEVYLMSGLTRGIPSLFADVKSLYNDEQKRKIVEDVMEQIREKFAPGGPFLNRVTSWLIRIP